MSQFDNEAYFLSEWITDTIENQSPGEIEDIREVFNGESWELIINKYYNMVNYNTWWEDGVNSYIQKD